MVSAPLVSVIMNCYNSDKYLHEAIDSVIAQTYSDWELIFWDNQSTDTSAAIFKSYDDSRLVYHYADRHTSLGEARNLAVNYAKGKWVAFLDCDDIWLPDKLAKQVEIINNEQDINLGIVYGRALMFGTNVMESELVNTYNGSLLPEGYVLNDLLLAENFIPLVSAIVLKDAFIEVGGIPNDFFQAEDYYIFVAIAVKYKVRAVQDICCKYRIHSSNITLKQKVLSYDESLRIIHKWREYITGNDIKELTIRRIKELNTYAGLMMIKYEKKLFIGIARIVSKGSIRFALTVLLKRF